MTGTVDASPARLHLQHLSRLGLGTRQLAALARVSPWLVKQVRAGKLTCIKPATAAQLLAIRPILAHGCSVPGTKTWRFVDSLEREGYTRREIAFTLGAKSQQLQLHHARVRVRSALRMAHVHDRLAAS